MNEKIKIKRKGHILLRNKESIKKIKKVEMPSAFLEKRQKYLKANESIKLLKTKNRIEIKLRLLLVNMKVIFSQKKKLCIIFN